MARPKRPALPWWATLLTWAVAVALGSAVQWAAARAGAPVLLAGTVGVGVLLVVTGTVALVTGLRGRRARGIAIPSAVVALCAASALAAPASLTDDSPVGDYRWAPTTATELTSYDVAVGTGVLDLRGLTAAQLDGRRVRAEVGVGDLVVQVPDDVTVAFTGSAGVGEVTVEESGRRVTTSAGVIHDGETTTYGSAPQTVHVDATVGVGSVRLERIPR